MVANGPAASGLPRVVADGPLDRTLEGMLRGVVEILPWSVSREGTKGARSRFVALTAIPQSTGRCSFDSRGSR